MGKAMAGHRIPPVGNGVRSGYSFGPPNTWRGVAQLGLERLVRDQEVASSNLVTPIFAAMKGPDLKNGLDFVGEPSSDFWGQILGIM